MNLKKSILALSALAVSAAVNAASINYQVQVSGYSKAGWITVVPELRGLLGGRVANLPKYGGWVTDRVSRGEPLRITILPDRPRETQCRGALVGISSSNGQAAFGLVRLPVSGTWVVTRDPSFDNVHLTVFTEAGVFDKRVPIGTR